MKRSNPQGKGRVPALEAWRDTTPVLCGPRSGQRLLADYCASLLVLAARFDFRPVPGNSYHLYQCADCWRLSLISPGEWGDRRPGTHVARCELRHDMTWSLHPAEDLTENEEVLSALEQHVRGFIDAVNTDAPLVDGLPFHVADLPFYPRLFASALARSLRNELHRGGASALSGRHLIGAIEAPESALAILPEAGMLPGR